MTRSAPNKSDAAFVARLESLFDQVPLEDAEVESILAEEGIDPAAVTARALSLVAEETERLRVERLRFADAERRSAVSQLESRLAARIKRSRDELLARFAELRLSQPQAAAMFRDFKSASDEDLASLVAELETLVGDDED